MLKKRKMKETHFPTNWTHGQNGSSNNATISNAGLSADDCFFKSVMAGSRPNVSCTGVAPPRRVCTDIIANQGATLNPAILREKKQIITTTYIAKCKVGHKDLTLRPPKKAAQSITEGLEM